MNNQELSLKLLEVLSKAYKVVMDRAVKDMKKKGLAETEFAVLEMLYNKGKFPLQRIGESVLVTSGGITYTIDKLENKGYLNRVACPEDRRVIYAEITEAGSKVYEEMFPSFSMLIENMMQGLTTEEKQIAITLLEKIGLSARKQV